MREKRARVREPNIFRQYGTATAKRLVPVAFRVSILGALGALVLMAGSASAVALDPAPSPAGASVGPLVRRIGAAYAEESHGVIGFRSHALVQTSPRFVRPDQVDDAWIVDVDGRAVQVRGGVATGPAATGAAVHQPYDARYAGEYRFVSAPCTGCAAGSVAVAYDTDAHDVAHGRGVMVVDERTARVLRMTVTPFVVPRPASTGSLTTTWGGTTAGWFPVATDGTFNGRIGPFPGHATLTQRFTGYKRYSDLASAERDAGTP